MLNESCSRLSCAYNSTNGRLHKHLNGAHHRRTRKKSILLLLCIPCTHPSASSRCNASCWRSRSRHCTPYHSCTPCGTCRSQPSVQALNVMASTVETCTNATAANVPVDIVLSNSLDIAAWQVCIVLPNITVFAEHESLRGALHQLVRAANLMQVTVLL